MHYFVYLDEFGHIGPFISRSHAKYNSSPVFGLGGIILPVNEVRNFSMFFYKQKNRLLGGEISQSQKHPSQWEKKGSELYTIGSLMKNPNICKVTHCIINKIEEINGFVFCTGIGKAPPSPEHKPEALYISVLKYAIRKLDMIFVERNSTFSLFLDACIGQQFFGHSQWHLSGL